MCKRARKYMIIYYHCSYSDMSIIHDDYIHKLSRRFDKWGIPFVLSIIFNFLFKINTLMLRKINKYRKNIFVCLLKTKIRQILILFCSLKKVFFVNLVFRKMLVVKCHIKLLRNLFIMILKLFENYVY